MSCRRLTFVKTDCPGVSRGNPGNALPDVLTFTDTTSKRGSFETSIEFCGGAACATASAAAIRGLSAAVGDASAAAGRGASAVAAEVAAAAVAGAASNAAATGWAASACAADDASATAR